MRTRMRKRMRQRMSNIFRAALCAAVFMLGVSVFCVGASAAETASADSDFSLLLRLLDFKGIDSAKTYDVNGIFEYSLSGYGTDVNCAGGMGGRIDSSKSDIRMNISVNADGAAADAAVVTRCDLDTGIIYVNVSGSQLQGMENMWYQIDIKPVLTAYGVDYDTLLSYVHEAGSGVNVSDAAGILRQFLNGGENSGLIYGLLNGIVGDSAFREEQSLEVNGISRAYVTNFSTESIMNFLAGAMGTTAEWLKVQSPELSMFANADIGGTLMIGLNEGGQVCTAAFTLVCREPFAGSETGFSYAQTDKGEVQMNLNFSADYMELLGKLYMQYTETSEAVNTLPPAGANPMDITGLLAY